MGQVERIAVTEKTAAKMMDMAPTEFRRLVRSGSLPLPVKITGKLERWRVSDLESVLNGSAMNEDEFSW
jgi:predicted DNA-binding transcriptional regulator AlpA